MCLGKDISIVQLAIDTLYIQQGTVTRMRMGNTHPSTIPFSYKFLTKIKFPSLSIYKGDLELKTHLFTNTLCKCGQDLLVEFHTVLFKSSKYCMGNTYDQIFQTTMISFGYKND